MKIAVTGASGFIGTRVLETLRAEGHSLHVLGRRPPRGEGVAFSRWDALAEIPPAEALDGAGAIVHLAGEPVAQRWTPEAKRRIRDSRVTGTHHLVNALSIMSLRPEVLVSASAVGYYGDRADEELTEASTPGRGFLAEVCRDWEETASLAEALGMRVVRLRIGVVLGTGGGALQQMLPPFRAGVGGRLSSGRQWMSWIHVDDLAGLIRFAIATPPLSGPVNATGPAPVTNREFTRTLAAALHRPALFTVPAIALKTIFGEMASVLLSSQRVLPAAALSAGFGFRYPDLRSALFGILRPGPK